MSKKRVLIQPVAEDGKVSSQVILVEKSFWAGLFETVWGITKNILALIGFIEIVSWFF